MTWQVAYIAALRDWFDTSDLASLDDALALESWCESLRESGPPAVERRVLGLPRYCVTTATHRA